MTRVERIGGAELWLGDCREVLAGMPADSVDAVVTDPPYHLTSIVKRFGSPNAAPVKVSEFFDEGGKSKGSSPYKRSSAGFMGKQWDGGDIAFCPETWAAVLRVMKPGAHLVAFGGTRTYHRLACAIEDAGFEVRDAIMWHYGSGFPKSLDVSKAIDKAAGAEREVVGSKLGRPGMAKNGSNQSFDNLRRMEGREDRPNPAIDITAPATDAARQWAGWGTALKPSTEIIVLARKPLSEPSIAANVLKWGTGALNIDGCRVGTETRTNSSQPRAERTGFIKGFVGGTSTEVHQHGRFPANLVHDGSPEVLEAFAAFGEKTSGTGQKSNRKSQWFEGGPLKPLTHDCTGGDTGTAARFFYASKANKEDRCGSRHPCIKPVPLMRWLVRLITPPNGVVLDCFAGTGTTLQAALLEGFSAIGIEREAEYFEDCKRRLGHMSGADAPLFADAAA